MQQKTESLVPLMAPQVYAEPVVALDEWASKTVLAGYRLGVPKGELCDGSVVLRTAESLGFPVVLKAVSAELSHKTEAGAVAINLQNSAALSAALDLMSEKFDQFLVEEMLDSVVAEIIIGVSRDETFGLTLMIGAGGTLVELLDDTASLLLPLQPGDVEEAIAKLKVGKLIGGYRSCEAGDKAGLIDAVHAIGRYAVDNADSLFELDINPLLVLADRVVAADAYIRKSDNA